MFASVLLSFCVCPVILGVSVAPSVFGQPASVRPAAPVFFSVGAYCRSRRSWKRRWVRRHNLFSHAFVLLFCHDWWMGGALGWFCSKNKRSKGTNTGRTARQPGSSAKICCLQVPLMVHSFVGLPTGVNPPGLLVMRSTVVAHLFCVLLSPVYVASYFISPVFLSSSPVCLLPFFIHFTFASIHRSGCLFLVGDSVVPAPARVISSS